MTEVFPGRPKVSSEKKKYEEVHKIPGKKIGNNNNNYGLRPSRRPLIQGHL